MATAPRSSSPRTAVIGRAHEKARLAELLDIGSTAKRAAVLIGEPGVGKTTLLRWAHEQAIELNRLTAFVRVPSAAGLPPRFPIGELLEGLSESCERLRLAVPDPLRRVLDTLRGATSADEYPAALPQIASALEVAAERAPIALFIDDFHWTPETSAQVLISSLRSIQAPAVIVCTSRLQGLDDHQTPIPQPTADLWVDNLPLSGMTPQEFKQLAEYVLGGEILPSVLDALGVRTGRNPLFATETLRSWQLENRIEKLGRFHSLSAPNAGLLPSSVTEAVEGRLPPPGSMPRSLLAILAIRARETSFSELLDITRRPHEDLLFDIRLLLSLQLVSETSRSTRPGYRIAHPLLEQSLLAALSQTDQAEQHLRIYEALKSRGEASPSELAHHAIRALVMPAELEPILRAAANQALAAGALEEAADWLNTLASISTSAEGRRGALLREAESRLAFDSLRARQLFTDTLSEAGDETDRIRALQGRAQAWRIEGHFEAAIEDLRSALTSPLGRQELDIHHALAILFALRGDLAAAEGAISAAAVLATTPNQHARVLGVRGSVAFCRSDFLAAHDLWAQAYGEVTDDGYRVFLIHNWSWSKILLGEWSLATELIAQGTSVATQRGDVWNLVSLLSSSARLLAWQGEINRALDAATTAIRLAGTLMNPVAAIDAQDALGVALLELDNPRDAYAALLKATLIADRSPELREISFTHGVAAEAALQMGKLDACERHLKQARAHLPSSTFWMPLIQRVEALLLVNRGQYAQGLDGVEDAIHTSLVPFETAKLHVVAAEISKKTRQHGRLVSHLTAALSLFEQLGAALHAGRTAAALKHVGSRNRGRPRNRTALGLTPRELDVLELVAKGMTNKEIAASLCVSPATVKTHVERLILKLEVSRRSELARRFASWSTSEP